MEGFREAMNINRHNYEAFFLLYVDKELSAADRQVVDVFVKENPDLQIELILLQDTVIKADDIVLDKKDWLYREEDITALQENLLLYADEELATTDKKAVKSLLLVDKTAQREWNILQQIKLRPDMTVVFDDKHLLYRKEGGKVVGFTWWKVAAAAVLLGFVLWTGVAVYKNNFTVKSGSTELANRNGNKKQQQIPDTNANVIAVPDGITTGNNTASIAVQDNDKTTSSASVLTAIEKKNNQNSIAPKENVTVQNNKKPGNNIPQPSLQNINRNGSNETIVASVQPSNNNSNRVSGNNDAAVRTNPKENTNNVVIASLNVNKAEANITAVQPVNNTTADGDNNDRYLNVADDREKRTALGGFLRKAKRVIERTTNIKTGEGVKIAGFEIALK